MAPLHTLTLAQHCGAVLMGKKPAALFTAAHAPMALSAASASLRRCGATLKVMRRCAGRCLLLVYRPELLATALAHPVAAKTLAALGYPAGTSLHAMLGTLQSRIHSCEAFPHEIGFFLGYPPADVVGFIHYKGQGYKHCCRWKVYSDVEKAKALCHEYDHCCHLALQHLEAGGSLEGICYLAHQAG